MRGKRVAARTQLKVDRQIVQNMYKRRNEQLVEAKSTHEDGNTCESPKLIDKSLKFRF